MLHWLGIKPSYSRPRVSDDNAFIEALFRTTRAASRSCQWVREFVSWYNFEHRHSAIRYVSPAQRHAGQDRLVLARRHQLYTRVRAANPRRWARHTRNWQPIAVVTLNPERESVVSTAMTAEKESASAA